jgi:hypothetical protein
VNALLEVTLERVAPAAWEATDADQAPHSESLRIVAVDGTWNGQRVTVQDVELSLCTLETDSHWLDAGTFHVLWPNPEPVEVG